MDSSTTSCYLCDDAFDVDDLQKFQPGFVLDWRSNLELKRTKILAQANPGSTGPQLSRVENTRPKNGEGEGDIVEGPIIRPHHERQRKKKLGDGHECEYDRFAANGRCVHCFEEHSFCNLLNISSRCELCHRVAEECSAEESKSFHLTNRLLELCKSQPRSICSDELSVHLDGEASRPLKVIVFSQFRASLNFVGDRLLRRFGTACIAEYFGKHRKEELNKFTSVPSCFCLLLTKDGAEGLDLSFVTNIVFFEEIYDKSLQDQAVARAWRMGARGQVEVETLIASKSVEETMGEQMHTEIYDDETSSMASCGDQQRLKSLLQSLRINTDYHHFSSQQDEWTGDGDNIKKMPASGSKRPLPSSALQQPVPLAKKATKVVKFSVLEEG